MTKIEKICLGNNFIKKCKEKDNEKILLTDYEKQKIIDLFKKYLGI